MIPLELGDLVVDPSTHIVTVAGKSIDLPRREFDLLHAMALQPGHVFSVDELLGMVWGAEFIGQPQVVYVHIRWLREKIELDPSHPRRIVTVRGVGYKLVVESRVMFRSLRSRLILSQVIPLAGDHPDHGCGTGKADRIPRPVTQPFKGIDE